MEHSVDENNDRIVKIVHCAWITKQFLEEKKLFEFDILYMHSLYLYCMKNYIV